MVRHLLELVDVVAVDPNIVVAQIQRAAASCAIKPPAIVQKCLGRDRARCILIEILFASDLGVGEAGALGICVDAPRCNIAFRKDDLGCYGIVAAHADELLTLFRLSRLWRFRRLAHLDIPVSWLSCQKATTAAIRHCLLKTPKAKIRMFSLLA